MMWIDKLGGMSATEDLLHFGDRECFFLCGHMAATILKKNKAYKVVKISQSDDDRGDRGEADQGKYAVLEDQEFDRRSECFKEKSGTYEEVEGRAERKEQRLPCLRRWERIKSLRAERSLRRRSEEVVKM